MKIAVWFLVGILSYLIAAVNPAILLSKLIYHKDIRECGSGNAGFTNFKRTFGNKHAWFVFALDILKTVFIGVFASVMFEQILAMRQIGVAFACVCAMIGHAYPVYYHFRGGKGFLVCCTMLFFLDWRSGILAFVILAILVLTVKYMSLSTMTSLVLGAVTLWIFGCNAVAAGLYLLCVLFMVYRHKENIKRLINGTESKFHLGNKKS